MLVQTFNPRTPAVACVVSHDYAAFVEVELERRRGLGTRPSAG